jgi:rubrerythrin
VHIQNVLKPLEDLEATLCLLYQHISDLFPLDEEARALFYKLSLEEKSHVAQVRYQRKLVLKNASLFGEVHIDTDEIRALTAEANAILAAKKRLSVEEAVKVALHFETSASEAHMRSAISQANPDMVRLLTALGGGDKSHLQGLLTFARRRGIAPDGVPGPNPVPPQSLAGAP